MKNYGFIRVAAATISVVPADSGHNTANIRQLICEAHDKGVSLIAFPELSISGYSCGDLFTHNLLIRKCEEEVASLAEFTNDKDITVVVGAPVAYNGKLYDCAIVIKDGEVKGIVPKVHLADNGGHCESRWFASGADLMHEPDTSYAGFRCLISPNLLFEIGDTAFAVEIGEDFNAPIPPSSYHAMAGAHIIVNLSAGNETVGVDRRRETALSQHSARTLSAYIYSSACGDSSQDMVFTGHFSIWENGCRLAGTDTAESLAIADIDTEFLDTLRRKSSSFKTGGPYSRVYIGDGSETDFADNLFRQIEKHPFAPADDIDYTCSKIIDLQTRALVTRLKKLNCKAVMGISGGLDSTLALIVTVLAFDRLGWKHEDIIAVTMPGFGTTNRTKNNAWELMKALGVTCREISIKAACEQHFKDISHDPSNHDATYENTQARERTQILMDIANQTNGIVVGTGDLSELALGWATYNGDHMSMYGVNAGVPKTLVRSLVKWAAENCFAEGMTKDTLLDIVDTPISPELLPANDKGEIMQVTEDCVGPYELHDFFIYNFIVNGYDPEKIFFLAAKAFDGAYDQETINKWLKTFIRRFFNQQFKRSCMPDGPGVCQVSLSPRGAWRMASDVSPVVFKESFE